MSFKKGQYEINYRSQCSCSWSISYFYKEIIKNSLSNAVKATLHPNLPTHLHTRTHAFMHTHTVSTCTVSAPPWFVSAVYPTTESSSHFCLSEFLFFACTLTTGAALFPFSRQTAHLQRQREGKREEKGKKMKSRGKPMDVNEKKKKKRQIALIMEIVRSCILAKAACTK